MVGMNYNAETFDPCSTDGTSEGGCDTCPMKAQCIPAPILNDLEDYFRDPNEPEMVIA